MLASRLRNVVHNVLGPSQHAFVIVRQILDAALIAEECVDTCLKCNKVGLLCKLDIEKAYDHISRDFMMYTLYMMFSTLMEEVDFFGISIAYFSVWFWLMGSL